MHQSCLFKELELSTNLDKDLSNVYGTRLMCRRFIGSPMSQAVDECTPIPHPAVSVAHGDNTGETKGTRDGVCQPTAEGNRQG